MPLWRFVFLILLELVVKSRCLELYCAQSALRQFGLLHCTGVVRRLSAKKIRKSSWAGGALSSQLSFFSFVLKWKWVCDLQSWRIKKKVWTFVATISSLKIVLSNLLLLWCQESNRERWSILEEIELRIWRWI